MSWRVVVIASNAKVDYKMDCLVVRKTDGASRIHLSEIGVLIVESTAVSITAYALCELMRCKVKVIFCDHARNPCAELVSACGSHDTSAKIRQQIRWQQSARQAVWTEIVREKIRRQRDHLCLRKLPQAELLSRYLGQLQLGDSTNREGHAAKVYFNALFGMEFSRSAALPVNAALNYGYSLILSALNREISAAGYLNQLGIFHENTFNPFNLGCDFLEPLRPLVDAAVFDLSPTQLEREEKLFLVDLLNREVLFDGRRQHLLYALRLYCAGLFRALQSGDLSEIRWIEYELQTDESTGSF